MNLRIFSVLILYTFFTVDNESYGQQQSTIPKESIIVTRQKNSMLKEAVVTQNDTLLSVEDWIRNNSIPLKTVNAGNGYDDLQPLKKMIGSSHLVAMGEATHGSCEFFRMKHRLLEFLVNEMGFTVFAMEAPMPESQIIDEYVLTGKGDPEKALAGFYNWVWNTEEVLDMIKWMRSYNSDPSHINKLKFYGFDMQSPSMAIKITIQNIGKINALKTAEFGKSLSMLSNPFTAPDFAVEPKAT
jgi:erythromycin esterase